MSTISPSSPRRTLCFSTRWTACPPIRSPDLTALPPTTAKVASSRLEDGILTGYMQDRQNARLMWVAATGNGRRQSYAHIPMPRMTNTIMLNGDADPADIVASVKDGIYAVNFGGGQVDITNGKFVFSCTEAYRVKGGKVLHPIKGATLIGDGPSALKQIRALAGHGFERVAQRVEAYTVPM